MTHFCIITDTVQTLVFINHKGMHFKGDFPLFWWIWTILIVLQVENMTFVGWVGVLCSSDVNCDCEVYVYCLVWTVRQHRPGPRPQLFCAARQGGSQWMRVCVCVLVCVFLHFHKSLSGVLLDVWLIHQKTSYPIKTSTVILPTYGKINKTHMQMLSDFIHWSSEKCENRSHVCLVRGRRVDLIANLFAGMQSEDLFAVSGHS